AGASSFGLVEVDKPADPGGWSNWGDAGRLCAPWFERLLPPHPNPPPPGGRELLLPPPLAGEGWGGGDEGTSASRGEGSLPLGACPWACSAKSAQITSMSAVVCVLVMSSPHPRSTSRRFHPVKSR